MSLIAPVAGRTPGIYQIITNANEDYPIAIPAFARGIIFWFETSAADATPIGGRFAVSGSATPIASITNTDNKLGYYPSEPVTLELPHGAQQGTTDAITKITHIHLTANLAGAVFRGAWLWGR